MTSNQKAFQEYVLDFIASCSAHGSIAKQDGDNWRAEFDTKLGKLTASIHGDSEYKSQTKHGFVSIYLRFASDAKAVSGRVYDELAGRSFNGYSGKWNIHVSGDKADIETVRNTALAELEYRLNFCRK